MSSHVATVRAFRNGVFVHPGEPLDYDGEPDPRFKPVDRAELRAWLETTADAELVTRENWHTEHDGDLRVGPVEMAERLRAKWRAEADGEAEPEAPAHREPVTLSQLPSRLRGGEG